MARDTRGPVPVGTTDLHRVNLNPGHWRQVRLMLGAEALVMTALGVAGFITVWVAAPRSGGVRVLGFDVTPTLSAVLLGIGVAAAVSTLRRRLAMWFAAVVGSAALPMVIASAVAATHGQPGPLGLTAATTLLYSAVFSYHLAIGMWLVPNHIEGPTWEHASGERHGPENA